MDQHFVLAEEDVVDVRLRKRSVGLSSLIGEAVGVSVGELVLMGFDLDEGGFGGSFLQRDGDASEEMGVPMVIVGLPESIVDDIFNEEQNDRAVCCDCQWFVKWMHE